MRKALLHFIERHAQHPFVRGAARFGAAIGVDQLMRPLLLPPNRRWQRQIILRNDASGGTGGVVSDVLKELDVAVRSDRPIVIGPWMSEVGFELLYWIPFMRWFVERFAVDPSRVTAVSRGGVASWYAGIAGRYVDIFSLVGTEAYRAANEKRHRTSGGGQKHITRSVFETGLLRQAASDADFATLHPELMYRLFFEHWAGRAGVDRVFDHVRVAPFVAPHHPILDTLPSAFRAVKLYASNTFPYSDDRARFVRELISNMAEAGPVVVLNMAVRVDDHADFAPPEHDNVHCFAKLANASDNLAAQTAIVARASSMVCTYGGFAYLPLLLGTSCVSLYATHANLSSHSTVVLRTSEQLGSRFSLVHESTVTNLALAPSARDTTKEAHNIGHREHE